MLFLSFQSILVLLSFIVVILNGSGRVNFSLIRDLLLDHYISVIVEPNPKTFLTKQQSFCGGI